LKRILDIVLVTDPKGAVTGVGQFEDLGEHDLPKGFIRPLQVKPIPPNAEPSC